MGSMRSLVIQENTGAEITNIVVTQKPDNTLKEIRIPIYRYPNNTLEGIRNLVPNRIQSQCLIGFTAPTYRDIN